MQDDDLSTIAQHERRLSVALERIARGLDRDPRPAAAPAASDAAALREELEAERATTAQLQERLRQLKDRDGAARRDAETRLEAMTRQLDLQGLELARMKKITAQLRDSLRALTDAAVGSTPDAGQINKAMQTELEALRALRQTEVAELDELLAALAPLTTVPSDEVTQDG